jgi:hypothetical protein
MENEKLYQCKISMSCKASSPAEAAEMLLANVVKNPNWYWVHVDVEEIDGNSSFTVDTENGEVEEK